MKVIKNSFALLFSPKSAWARIGREPGSLLGLIATHTIPMALIPAVCWFYGVTQQGWSAAGETVRLTVASALPTCILFFFAIVYCVLFLGYLVHWMANSYDSQSTVARGVALITYSATPFFFAGLFGLLPLLWLDILVGTIVSGYCIYLLYVGTPFVMQVSTERGFLFSSAVFAAALVAFVGLLGATVVLWQFGPTPEYLYAP